MELIGRRAEIDLFEAAIASPTWPWRVLWVHGPGGIGKSALLRAWSQRWEAAEQGVRQVVFSDPWDPPLPADVLALPEGMLLVVVTRQAPPPEFREAVGPSMHAVELGALSPADAAALLAQRKVPAKRRDEVQALAHGLPLALVLYGDSTIDHPKRPTLLQEHPDVLRSLLGRLIGDPPSAGHEQALALLGIARWVTEDLVRAVVPEVDARAVFDWLRALPTVVEPLGLALDPVARDAVAADVRWRLPEQWGVLFTRVLHYFAESLRTSLGTVRERYVTQIAWLFRTHPVIGPCFEWAGLGEVPVRQARPSDDEAIDAIAVRYGDTVGATAEWLLYQPDSFVVTLDESDAVSGYAHLLPFVMADDDGDPVTEAAQRHVANHGGLRDNESALIARTWSARDTGRAISPVQSALFLAILRAFAANPRCAWIFVMTESPKPSKAVALAGLQRVPEAPGLFALEWRRQPLRHWLDAVASEWCRSQGIASPLSWRPSVDVLSREDFEFWVKRALRGFAVSDGFRDNPLLDSRMVLERSRNAQAEAERGAALRELIVDASQRLRASKRVEKLWRALDMTYLRPSRTQEEGAESLGLPFSTFRRHLTLALNRVTDMLWDVELGDKRKQA